MSNVHPFSQAGFWDFVAGLKDRESTQKQATANANGNRATGRVRGGRKGPGNRARNAVAADDPMTPLTELPPAPYTPESDFNEKALPPQYPAIPNQAETFVVLADGGNTATHVTLPTGGEERGVGRRGRGRGLGRGPRGNGAGGRGGMREVLFDDGTVPSEEEKAARAERRRLRREANGKGNGLGPRARRLRRGLAEGQDSNGDNDAMAMGETSQKQQQRGGRPLGRRHRRNAEAPGPRSLQPGSENLVDVTSSDEKMTGTSDNVVGHRGRRGGLWRQGARAMSADGPTHLDDIVQGGPRKFAAIAAQQGADPSNGENGPHENGRRGQGLGPSARKLAALRKQAELSGQGCPECGRDDADLPRRAGRQQLRALRRGMRRQTLSDNEARAVISGPETEEAAVPLLETRDLTTGDKEPGKEMKKQQKSLKNNTKKIKNDQSNKKFKPRADIFETQGSYVVHMPVPGATQKDIGVTWDTEKNVLRVAGIVKRPELQQVGESAALLRAQRPVGTFKRVVKLAKKGQTAKVYENGITATLEDGILKIDVPKYDGPETISDGEYIDIKSGR